MLSETPPARHGFCLRPTRRPAASTARFLDKLVGTVPFKVKVVQVDDGFRFMAELETACRHLD